MNIYVKVPLHTFLSLCGHRGNALLLSSAGQETGASSRTEETKTRTIRLRLERRVEGVGYVSAEDAEEDGEE